MSTLDQVKPGRFFLSGVMDFDSASELVEKGWQVLKQHVSDGRCVVDLSGVRQADSSALSVLFSWLRRARSQGLILEFTGFPEALMSLAKVCEVDKLLPQVGTVDGG